VGPVDAVKTVTLVVATLLAAAVLAGCGPSVSVSDVQKNAAAQQKWLKEHPGRSDSGTEP
jgi:hypothetical protein